MYQLYCTSLVDSCLCEFVMYCLMNLCLVLLVLFANGELLDGAKSPDARKGVS